jgi:beta-glucosidase
VPPLELEAGRAYDLRLTAGEAYGDAQVQFLWAPPHADLLGDAVAAARDADAVVLFLGLTPGIEGEEMPVEIEGFRGGDRTDIALPAVQQELMQRVVALGRPTVLVLLNGSAVAVNWAEDNVGAILEAWYPGQAAGDAIADVLFGDYNPAGRLPVTFYRSVEDLPPFVDYDVTNRTYRYFQGEPLYAFGHGLSYTSFAYDNLRTSAERLVRDGTVTVSVDVRNSGDRAGDEVVQLYVSYPESEVDRPRKQLVGFSRIHLQPGEKTTVRLPLEASDLAYWDAEYDRWVVEARPVRLLVGASSADIREEATLGVGE